VTEFPAVTPPNSRAAAAARRRQDILTKPAGALGRLENLSVWVASCQGHCPPRQFERARIVVFAGDHGVARTGVSAYPPEVTAQMVANIDAGGAAINALAEIAGATVRVVDIAVDTDGPAADYKVRRSSGNIAVEDALSENEVLAALDAGRRIADEEVDAGADLLIAGDMGIGNTTAATTLIATLTDTVAILRSLAEVCDLEAVDNVLDAAPGFSVLSAGEQAFTGRAGERLWNELGAVVVDRWDEVVDALDGIVTTPEVQADALETAQAEAAAIAVAEKVVEGAGVEGTATSDEDDEDDRDEDLEFWDETGVDCLEVTVGERTGWTLRCYLGEDPVFLSQGDRIQIYSSPEALENYLIETDPQHSLASLGVWPDIRTAVVEGDAAVMAGPENTYLLNGLAKDLLAGPENVDRDQLTLGVELLVDAATARGDTETVEALGSSTPLGNLVSIIIKPDPARMTPSPPFDDEAAAWSILVDRFVSTLDWDGERQ